MTLLRCWWNRAPLQQVSANALLMMIGLSGCATYNGIIEPSRQALSSGNFDRAYSQLEKRAKGGHSAVCYNAELGIIAHTKGDYDTSNRRFQVSESKAREFDEKAIISVTDLGADIGTLLINEKAKPYRGEGYEKVLFNTYMALNYLMNGDAEGARVEVRRAYTRQQEVEDIHRREMEAWKRQAKEQEAGEPEMPDELKQRFSPHQDKISGLANAYKNAFTCYLSSLVYELNREPDHAYVDCKEAYRLRPDVKAVQQDLIRLSRAAASLDEHESWKSRFLDLEPGPSGEGTDVILIFQNGLAPYKEQIMIPVPVPKVGIIPIAFPIYETIPARAQRARLSCEGESLGETELLADIDAMALRSLWDQIPVLLIKQAVRATVKGYLVKEAYDEGGVLAGLFANIFTVLSEQADLRAWRLLPKDIQVLRTRIPADAGALSVEAVDASGSSVQRVKITLSGPGGERIFINVRSVDHMMTCHVAEY